MQFLIPTYRREKVLTVDALLDFGVEGRDITIGTQTECDYRNSVEKYGSRGVNVLKTTSATNAAGNRNALLRHCGEQVVALFDDDILSLDIQGEEIYRLFDDLEKAMQALNLSVLEIDHLGIEWPMGNLAMGWTYSGTACLVRVSDCEFDESLYALDDLELHMRLLKSGKHVAYTTKARAYVRPDGNDGGGVDSGGCAEAYSNGAAEITYERLAAKYPEKVVRTNMDSKPFLVTYSPCEWRRI